ncbi:MAG: insulinase family protein [Bdellovibrionaceae bacterium]|nr:insulinase family protein [Pseudobdellovibrionaceae bacterium]
MLRQSLMAGVFLFSALAFADDFKIRFPVEKYQLPNGLTVLLHEDHTVPMVSYHTWYRVGSRDEQPGVTGAAHMLEHMMFKGAKKYSGKEFDHILHANGITNNAFTSWDYTGFYENLPSSKLELIMDMEVDRMRFLALSPDDLKSELQVVGEERRWRVDNNPMGLLRESLFDVAFPKSPYQWPVIGYMVDIQAYTTEKLKYFYDKFYVPNNAVLVVAGDFETAKVKKMIEKYYGVLQPSPLAERTYAKSEVPKKPVFKTVESEVQTSTLMLGYPGVTAGSADSYALDMLANMLGAGSSSRLYKKMVYRDQIATSAVSYNMTNAASGLFTVSVALKPGQNEKAAEASMKAEVRRLATSPVTQKELDKAKAQLMKDFVDGLQTIDGKAQQLALNEILFGSYDKLFTDLEKYQAVTLADVQRVVKEYLKPEREIVVLLKPKSAKVSANNGAQQ